MNKHILAAITMALALAACSEKAAEEKPAEGTPAASAPASEATDTASSGSGLDATCEAYFKRVETCVGKLPGATADQFKQGMNQVRDSLKTAGAAQQAEICKMADEQFAQAAKTMQCE